MPTTSTRSALMFLLLLGASTAATAQGIIVDRHWNISSVVLDRSNVDVQIRDNVAHVVIDHVFRNDGRSAAEGIFLFPLPADAVVSDFKMEMNGELVGGEVLPADEAKKIYQRIVRRNLDPALLEWVDGQSFRASIFPIARRSSQKIVLEYDLILDQVGNRYRFTHPLAGTISSNAARPRRPWIISHPPVMHRDSRSDRASSHEQNKDASELSLSLSINGKDKLRNVYSPSHEVDVDYKDDRSAGVTLQSLNKSNSSFVLYYSMDADEISSTLIPYRPYRDRPGYFMLMVAPPTKPTGKVQPKEIVFVLDTSGSMAGDKIGQAKSALKYALNRLGSRDSFGLIAFNSDLDLFDTKLVSASAVDDALFFVDQLEARGGTNINDAVLQALDVLGDSDNGSIVFLTDGLPSSGVTNIDKIISNVQGANKHDVTLFSFGVGYDVNTKLLGDLSESTSAFAEYITPDENLEEAVSVFYDRIRYPVLTDVSLEIRGAGVHALAPRSLPDLYVGDPLILTGRFRNSGKTKAVLSGRRNGERVEFVYKVDFPNVSRRESFVAQTWATRRVGLLLTDVRRNGETPELKDEIIALATEYGIVTPYTSYLVQEDDLLAERVVGGRRRSIASSALKSMPRADYGVEAVAASEQLNKLQQTDRYDSDLNVGIQSGGQNFVKDAEGSWTSNLAADEAKTNGKPALEIQFASEAYFELLARYPEMKEFLRVGNDITFVFREQLVQIGENGRSSASEADFRNWFGS